MWTVSRRTKEQQKNCTWSCRSFLPSCYTEISKIIHENKDFILSLGALEENLTVPSHFTSSTSYEAYREANDDPMTVFKNYQPREVKNYFTVGHMYREKKVEIEGQWFTPWSTAQPSLDN